MALSDITFKYNVHKLHRCQPVIVFFYLKNVIKIILPGGDGFCCFV